MSEPWSPLGGFFLAGTGKTNSKLHLKDEVDSTESLCGVGVVGGLGAESTYTPHKLCMVCRRMYVTVTSDEPPVTSLL